MTGIDASWVVHSIADIGLTFNVFGAWPLLSMGGAGATGIYQPVADTSGIVFVRYGPEDTVDAYIGTLGGMFTQVSLMSDTPAVVDGRQARRVTVRMVSPSAEMYDGHTSKGVTHRTLPEERTHICVIAFTNRGMSILAGYRMPEGFLERYRDPLERILSSISLS